MHIKMLQAEDGIVGNIYRALEEGGQGLNSKKLYAFDRDCDSVREVRSTLHFARPCVLF